jgi:hypothetical protein
MDGSAQYVLTQSTNHARAHAFLTHLLHSENSLANAGNSPPKVAIETADKN